jgi:translation initiation factor IF-3
LVDENGEQLGVVDTREALAMARERDLDLVEVSPNSKPPVCRIMDYGKYLYTQKKKKKEAKKSGQPTTIKEIKVSAKIEEHDLAFKISHIEKFLKQKYRVKVSVFFRGREITHTDRGRDILNEVIKRLGDNVNVETQPRLEGRTMAMLLAPVSGSKKKKTDSDNEA